MPSCHSTSPPSSVPTRPSCRTSGVPVRFVIPARTSPLPVSMAVQPSAECHGCPAIVSAYSRLGPSRAPTNPRLSPPYRLAPPLSGSGGEGTRSGPVRTVERDEASDAAHRQAPSAGREPALSRSLRDEGRGYQAYASDSDALSARRSESAAMVIVAAHRPVLLDSAEARRPCRSAERPAGSAAGHPGRSARHSDQRAMTRLLPLDGRWAARLWRSSMIGDADTARASGCHFALFRNWPHQDLPRAVAMRYM